jgi:hypothetical protein
MKFFRIHINYKSFGIQYMIFSFVPVSGGFQGVTLFNYTRFYLNLPIFIISTIIPIFCYTYVRHLTLSGEEGTF